MAHVIETVTFRLTEGTAPEAFAEAARGANGYIESCDGFVARRLSRAEDGTWIEHIEWRDMEAARAAAAGIGAALGGSPFLSAIDGPTVELRHSHLAVSVN